MTNWMSGYNGQGSEQAPAWVQGQSSVTRQVLCCPDCGSLNVFPRDHGLSETMKRFECESCGVGFKVKRDIVTKCYMLD